MLLFLDIQFESFQVVSSFFVYVTSIVILLLPWPILLRAKRLGTLSMLILLFVLDIVLTVEAALYSDILLIALLHVITIPALILIIYFDLVKQHRSYFRCFICGKEIKSEDELETMRRAVMGKSNKVLAHSNCIMLDEKQKKKISSSVFRHGIPK